MVDISFIMPAKNESKFIKEAISTISKSKIKNWEIIVVDDHSEDSTFDIVNDISKEDNRVKIYSNDKNGKVSGLNLGYKESKGKIIKCIDSDDTLSEEFFENFQQILSSEVSCHDYYITDENNNKITVYSMNQRFFSNSYENVLETLTSLPRAVWSFNRDIGNLIFPMPEALPYEDVWFSLIIKRNAASINYINMPLYNYRQHGSQTFGGVLNYSVEKTIFRAKRLVNLIGVLEQQKDKLSKNVKEIIQYQKLYYYILGRERLSIHNILSEKLKLSDKIKIILFRKFPGIVAELKKLQWKLDNIRQ